VRWGDESCSCFGTALDPFFDNQSIAIDWHGYEVAGYRTESLSWTRVTRFFYPDAVAAI
jgi:hypothetical protein